jgi:hypothetical protein
MSGGGGGGTVFVEDKGLFASIRNQAYGFIARLFRR